VVAPIDVQLAKSLHHPRLPPDRPVPGPRSEPHRARGGPPEETFRHYRVANAGVGRVRLREREHLVGLIGAVEFVAEKTPPRAFDPALKVGARVTRRCLELGLITRALPGADTIAFSPPFVVSEAELDEMVAIARRAVDEVGADLQREA
jgi:adenosylmethionine-8-amino-7-oxononanoate aminotransferase